MAGGRCRPELAGGGMRWQFGPNSPSGRRRILRPRRRGWATAAQLAQAQKAARRVNPATARGLSWKAGVEFQRFGEVTLDAAAQAAAQEQRIAASGGERADLAGEAVAGRLPAFTRADLIEALSAHAGHPGRRGA